MIITEHIIFWIQTCNTEKGKFSNTSSSSNGTTPTKDVGQWACIYEHKPKKVSVCIVTKIIILYNR